MSYDRKHKLEYHLASTHNKIDNKLPQNLETEQLPLKNEYFQDVKKYILLFYLFSITSIAPCMNCMLEICNLKILKS